MKKRTTAVELLAKLNSDPEFVATRDAAERRHKRHTEELLRAEVPLLEELRSVGFSINSVWDFVNTSDSYPSAIPILLKHLSQDYPDAVTEGIARALATPTAGSGWKTFVGLYRGERRRRAKDGLAVAIAATANDNVIGEVIELALDPANGASRLLLLKALERSQDPRAHEALEQLVMDSDLESEVNVILHRLKN